ncbi:ATPase [Clostridium sp. AF43-10]|nr:ATPase [Clostridium sp. AF43-10]
MAVPKVDGQFIAEAIKYIDDNGVPWHNTSTKYELVWKNGNTYPPKYVLAVANHLQNGAEIDVSGYNAVEAKNYLMAKGYEIQIKQTKYEITITADSVTSTDDSFTMDNISAGDVFKPLDASFVAADGTVIKRNYGKGERRNTNQTLPRLAFQIYEEQIVALPVEEKEQFPICQYRPDTELIKGIYYSVDNFKASRNTIEYLTYNYGEGRQFVIYSWNIFTTLRFVQECLKRFGNPGDAFKLIYREKDEKENAEEDAAVVEEVKQAEFNGYLNPYSTMLVESKNIIFRGAPGTGKTYLAKEIATDIISNGYFDDYTMLTDEQKQQVEFVQFHPSYDYSDFVEGLRPKTNEDGSMGFELQDGVFKKFVDKARRNYENSKKSKVVIANELSVQDAMKEFFDDVDAGNNTFKTKTGTEFTITDVDDEHIYLSIPQNASINSIRLNISEIRQMLESGREFDKLKDITEFFNINFTQQRYSYNLVIFNEIQKKKKAAKIVRQEELKKYVFIIDEINRGEVSKIFGELFFAVDPGYRGAAGEVSTQYANLHADSNEKFYIPDNVYIIGTMNDIDRSVDSFDFAMRRRFRFVELRADERLEMLANLNDEEKEAEAIARMSALNAEIAVTEGLNENYQIGASYFLKLKNIDFDQLWSDYLHPLLQEYINGMYDEEGIMERFRKAYSHGQSDGVDVDESN